MNIYTQTSGMKRVLVLMLATGAFAFSACGSESKTPEVAPPIEDTGYTGGSIYIRPAEPDTSAVPQPHDDARVRTPGPLDGGPTVPNPLERRA
jgi:hypothetical protein